MTKAKEKSELRNFGNGADSYEDDRRGIRRSEMRVFALLLSILFLVAPSIGIGAGIGEDYVRPQPRRALSLSWPWNRKHSSGPQQVHISLAGEKHMRISWVTEDKTIPSFVEYGKSPGQYTESSVGINLSYKYLFYSSGKIHHVVIGPLEDSTVYYYRCGGQEPEFQFKTPPSKFPLKFSVAGDLGQTEWTSSTLEHISQCQYDLHLLPGDLSYAYYQQQLWDSFGELIQPYASARPWMVTEGNHEQESIPFIESPFQSYNARWKMPYEESGSTSNLYYSFEVSGVHIIMLGSYTDYDEHSDQYAWLKADLSKVDRVRTPWLVALQHVPWYNSNWAHQGEGDDMMVAMEPLLYAYGVDIVIAGHVHAYERTERVYGGHLDSCGAVHITIGDGGNREGLAHRLFEKMGYTSILHFGKGVLFLPGFRILDDPLHYFFIGSDLMALQDKIYQHPKPVWSAFREASFGHGELNIVNETHASWSWHRNDDHQSFSPDMVWINSFSSSECLRNGFSNFSRLKISP